MRRWFWCVLLVPIMLLVGCSSAKPLVGLVIPYSDTETFVYDFVINGDKLTEVKFVVKKDQYEQQAAWLMSMDLSLNDQAEVNEVWTDPGSLQPLYSRIQLRSPQGSYDIRARYDAKKLVMEADTPQGKQQVERNLSGVVYDNAQILMTLRALPLSDRYQSKFEFVQTKNVSRGEMTVKVVGREKVQVPAGEFDCYRVEMSIQGAKQSSWYSTDAKRWLVKYDNGQSQFALQKVS